MSESKQKSVHERLLELQKAMKGIKKDSENPYFKSKYFDINSLLREIKPALNKLNFVVFQPLKVIDGRSAVETNIIDASDGNVVLSGQCLIPDGLKAQDMGSAITYIRRYGLQSLLSLEAEDDDGNSASGRKVEDKNKGGNPHVKEFFDKMPAPEGEIDINDIDEI